MAGPRITVMGSFITDLVFRTGRLPAWGQTLFGSAFQLGPGGKGSNQAVAAARLGARVAFISKLGRDAFAELARRTWAAEGIDATFVCESTDGPTGAATIAVSEETGDNAIVVVPGSGLQLTSAEVERASSAIEGAAVFLTQLETPVDTVRHALAAARRLGIRTILNPAPAVPLPDDVLPLCDYLTPNESETEALVGNRVAGVGDAERAAGLLLARGAGAVVVTLGARGALVKSAAVTAHVPAFDAGPVVDTTGAGDAFNGGLAVALAEGRDLAAAARFACAAAAISVTRHGTAPAMPRRAEVEALLSRPGS